MTLAENFSKWNSLNSVARYFADQLLAAGYLVYWHQQDAMETGDGLYYEYATNYASYLSDPTYSAAIDSASGVVCLMEEFPATPRFITRPITDGSAPDADEVPIPAFSIGVSPAMPLTLAELGNTIKFRGRHLLLFGYARTAEEQGRFADYLALWFDPESMLEIFDHDGGDPSISVGHVRLRDSAVSTHREMLGSEAQTFEVACNSLLEYVA